MIAKRYRPSALLSILVLGLWATTSVPAEEIDPKALLERASAEIAGLDGFIVAGDAYTDARLSAGQIIEHTSQVTLRLARPGSIRITNRDGENTQEIFFHDGLLSVHGDGDNFYAQTQIPKGVDSALDFAVNRVGIEAPLLDFVAKDVAGHLLEDTDEVRYLGKSLIRDEMFHHIGIRSQEVDMQLWIASEGRPLPGKIVITSKWEGGSPRFVGFLHWDPNPDFPPDTFKFDPPDDAVAIEFLIDRHE